MLVELLVIVVHGFDFWVSSLIFWVNVGRRKSSGRFMIAHEDLVL